MTTTPQTMTIEELAELCRRRHDSLVQRLDELADRLPSADAESPVKTIGEQIAEHMIRGKEPYPIAMFRHDAPAEPPTSTLLGSVPAACSLSQSYCEVTLRRARAAIADAIDAAIKDATC